MALALGFGLGLVFDGRNGGGLPGTYYDFTGASLPGPWETLRRSALDTFLGAGGLLRYNAHNLLRWSEDISNAVWPGFSGWSATSATQVTVSAGGSNTRQTISAGTTAGVSYTLAVTVQKLSGAITQLSADIGDGATQPIPLTGTTTRVVVPLVAGASGAFLDLAANAAGSFTITAMQLTIGGGTDYVPTTTAPVYLPSSPTHSAAGAVLGLQVQGQATQYWPKTDSLEDWFTFQSSVTQNNAVSPSGALNADTLTLVGSSAIIRNEITIAAGLSLELSGFLRRPVGSATSALRVTTNDAVSWGTGQSTLVPLTNNWVRFSLPITTTAATRVVLGKLDASGNPDAAVANGEVEVWGVNIAPPGSYIPNPGTGTAVRTGDFAGGGISGASLTALLTPTQPFTIVLPFRKANNAASVETLLGLCAGASAGTTNQLGIATNGTQAQLVHSGGSGALTGTLVLDGSTVNKVAVSVDPAAGKMSISVNGSAVTETTGIAYTGSGTTHLIPGARDSSGGQPATGFTSPGIRVASGYITGSALQALST